MGLGASADWGIITEAFLRLFDSPNHDIASTTRELERFLEVLDACFRRGGIFVHRDADGAVAAGGEDAPQHSPNPPRRFTTSIVREQTKSRAVFRCGNQQVLVWGKCTAAQRQDLAARLHLVTDTTEARLRAEFSEHDTQAHFGCFDVLRIREAFSEGALPQLRRRLLNKARLLAHDFGMNTSRFVLEYNELVPVILQRATEVGFQAASNGAADNRPTWTSIVLDDVRLSKEFPTRTAPFSESKALVQVWNSIDHGECQVERDIGDMRAELEEHVGIGDKNLCDILVVQSFGPKSLDELFGAEGEPTALVRSWDASWREKWGSRFGLYAAFPRREPTKRAETTKTYAAIKRGVLRASSGATQAVRDGVADTTFAPPVNAYRFENSPHWNSKLARFSALTRQKSVAASVFASQRRAGNHAFPTPKLRCGVLGNKRPVAVETVAFCPPSIGDTAGALQTLTGTDSARRADLIIVEKTAALCESRSQAWTLQLLYIFALGKPVVTRSAWRAANAKLKKVDVSKFLHHFRLATQQAVTFILTREFVKDCAELHGALEIVAATPNSKWCVLKPGDAKVGAKNRHELTNWQTLKDWLIKHRRLKNSGMLVST